MAWMQGTDLMKHGRHGKPKVHYFRLAESDTHLTWRSAKGNQRGVSLSMVKQVTCSLPLCRQRLAQQATLKASCCLGLQVFCCLAISLPWPFHCLGHFIALAIGEVTFDIDVRTHPLP